MNIGLKSITVPAIAFIALLSYSNSAVTEVRIEGFEFGCTASDGKLYKPRLDNFDPVVFSNMPDQANQCLTTVEQTISLCHQITDFAFSSGNQNLVSCVPDFEEQAQKCVEHYESERSKCANDLIASDIKTTDDQPQVDAAYVIKPDDRTITLDKRRNVREGPGVDYPILATLDPGTEVQVSGDVQGRDWLHVELAESGSEGFMYVPSVSVAEADDQGEELAELTEVAETTEVEDEPVTENQQRVEDSYVVDSVDRSMTLVKRRNVREGPGVDYPILATLDPGTEVQVSGEVQDRDWLHVELAEDGSEGFMYVPSTTIMETVEWEEEPAELTEIADASVTDDQPQGEDSYVVDPVERIMVLAKRRNVREGPDVEYLVLETLDPGTEVQISGDVQGRDWLRVELADDGIEGFMYVPLMTVAATAESDEEPAVLTEEPTDLTGAVEVTEVTDTPTAGEPEEDLAEVADVADAQMVADEQQQVEETYLVEPVDRTIVLVKRRNVREGPSLDYTVLATLDPGTEVQVSGDVQGRDWLRVELADDGNEGFMYVPSVSVADAGELEEEPVEISESAELTEVTDPPTADESKGESVEVTEIADAPISDEQPQVEDSYAVDSVNRAMVLVKQRNVREGPGVDYPIMVTLDPDTIVLVSGEVRGRDWLRIKFAEEGGEGFIYVPSMSVSVADDPEEKPTEPTETAGIVEVTDSPAADESDEAPAELVEIADAPVTADQPQVEDSYVVDPVNQAMALVKRRNVREGPGVDYPVLATLDPGTEVQVSGNVQNRDWLRVELAEDGSEGFMYVPSVSIVVADEPKEEPTELTESTELTEVTEPPITDEPDEAPAELAEIADSQVTDDQPQVDETYVVDPVYRTMTLAKRRNVREGPGVDYPVLATLDPDTEVQVSGNVQGRDWLRVELAEDGSEGFMYVPSTTITETAKLDEAPTALADPNWSTVENQPCVVWNYNSELTPPFNWSGVCTDGKVSGQGRLTFHSIGGEGFYLGSMKAGKLHGQGEIVWANQDSYQGDWREGWQYGRGTLKLSNGDQYSGDWFQGEKHGHGTYIWANGDRFIGGFLNGQVHGRGIFTWANGDRYDGEFRNGLQHGQGTYSWRNGKSETCEWENHQPVDGTCIQH